MSRARILKRLALVTFVLLLALNWVAFFEIRGGFSEPQLLDLRPLGYSLEEARLFAQSLSFEAKAAYREVYLILDYVFIGFLAATLFVIGGGMATRALRLGLWALTCLFVVADIAENRLVSLVVEGGWQVAQAACIATQVKFMSLALAAIVIAVAWRKGAFR